MIDFTITVSGQTATMSFDKSDSLANNVFLGLHIARGSLFVKTDFGSRLHELKKITDTNLALAESYAKEALQWLVTAGRVQSVDVTATRDAQVPNRILLYIAIVKPDNETAEYQLFYTVV